MGYESDEYVLKCGCIKYVKSHDFFDGEKEISFKYCEKHIERQKELEYEKSEKRKQLKVEWEKTDKAKTYRKEYGKEYAKTEKAKEAKQIYHQGEKYKQYQKEYNKEYREKNKEKIDAIKNKKTECNCGGSYVEKNKAKHFRTIKHQEWEKQKQPEM